MEILVGEIEKRDIRAQVDRILRDLGNPEPPLSLSDVRALLSLDLHYYNSSDPGLIQELSHRFKLLARKSIPDLGNQLLSALAKSRLCAFWVPESARILVDADVPDKKLRWIEAHEITHSVTPWHKHFLLGDNAHTLDPACHAILEAEANYGAGRLIFLQDQFARDAQSLPLSFDSIKLLSKRYGNSIVSTFWRSIEERDPDHAVFGMVSIHPNHPHIGKHEGADPWRYFIQSAGFRVRFASISALDAFSAVRQVASWRTKGPVGTGEYVLTDANGEQWVFHVESFCNGHAVLTFGFPLRRHSAVVVGLRV
jgi:hypothetical protein